MKHHLLHKKHLLSILFLGFASGLPVALTGSVLQAWFTLSNFSLEAIGAITLIGQPYLYKFLWAPFFDYYAPPFLGRRRSWLLITQIALLFAIGAMGFFDPHSAPYTLIGLAVIVAFLSASQDTVFNAYMTDITPSQERGLAAALQNSGYRFAMMLSGGVSLILAAHIGWHATFLILAGCMVIGIITTLLSDEPANPFQSIKNNKQHELLAPLKELVNRKMIIIILLFILFYKLGDALSLSLATPFLMRGLGFSLTVVGSVFKGAGLIASLLGIWAGGIIMLRLSLYRSLLLFGVLQIIAILMLLLLAIVGKNYFMLVLAISSDSFFNGMGTTALVAFLMSQCDHRYTATQFALLSAFSLIGRIFIGPLAGFMVTHIGWAMFFFYSALACIPALLLLPYLKSYLVREVE